MARLRWQYLLFILGFIVYIHKGEAIQCYQCDSNEDGKQCPQEEAFDTKINAVVDCNSFEAYTPGKFCVKIYQESPGWNGWIKITRRCASQTDEGVAWGCRWQWDDVGVFKNTCYCESDGCNGASSVSISFLFATILGLVNVLWKYL
ncbi:hypothetical protein CHS0354_028320 [Potamilus streckersoni]|uniref:UPAR/Ly6 domain-containing protein qvr n=1 Tax=Potamilus streckersoni TaxID=2493646 RepID=A0AAE0RTZ0_9BIVA|nr:hypothetical protein CHS0354_028320 [Potamilus streckersoni]